MAPIVKDQRTRRGGSIAAIAGALFAIVMLPAITFGATRLQGAGASFPAPFYKRLVVVYQGLHPDVLIDYQSIGSGGGIRAITDKTVHFCASDAPMGKKELAAVGGDDKMVEFPACAGGIVPIFNVPGIDSPLKFSGELLADIYLGKVSQWNDPAIVKLNPGVRLPDLFITPVWRTDGSGTNFIFTSYLTTQSQDFAFTVGMGKQVQWPFGQGGKGNEGVTAVVQQVEGSVGYVEQSYADNNHLVNGIVENKAGKFVRATPAAISKAGASADFPKSGTLLAADIWNQPGEKAYPIASFTYVIVYKDMRNLPSEKAAQDLAGFLWWATHEGQRYAPELGYAPLAPEVVNKVEAALKTLNYKGAPLKVGE
ncbi:MAG: phosphate ABC transporter substrate-binding protein PstS [Pirellulales bacterium]